MEMEKSMDRIKLEELITENMKSIFGFALTRLGNENEAEDLACSALYSKLLSAFGKTYDISQTRYSVGSITGSPSAGFTVSGKYSLYDKYGNYQKSNNFSVKVDSSGKSTVLEY